jgi:serine/threonine-protein kinase RsbT
MPRPYPDETICLPPVRTGGKAKVTTHEEIRSKAATAYHDDVALRETGSVAALPARARGLPERKFPRGAGGREALGAVLNAATASEARVRIESSADIVVARQQGRALASLVGFSNSHLTMIVTAISEVARNIVEHAKEGDVTITLIKEGNRRGVKIVASDQGPGIADIVAAMLDGFSTSQGLGIGLPGARRLMDQFEIASEIDRGTTITMKKWL